MSRIDKIAIPIIAALTISISSFIIFKTNTLDGLNKKTEDTSDAAVVEDADERSPGNLTDRSYQGDSYKDGATLGEAGRRYQSSGKLYREMASKINCLSTRYNWESPDVSCQKGKKDLMTLGENMTNLGECYVSLDNTYTRGKSDTKIRECMSYVSSLTESFNSQVFISLIGESDAANLIANNRNNMLLLEDMLEQGEL